MLFCRLFKTEPVATERAVHTGSYADADLAKFDATYSQTFAFSDDGLCNLTRKTSKQSQVLEDDLNFDYVYAEGHAHRLERSLLSNTTDTGLSTDYLYGTDGQSAVKRSGRSEVLYFNKFFSENFRPEFTTDALMTKNIFLGTERIVTKQCSKDAREGFAEAGTQSEADQQYYYHADHLGSVSAITDADGDVYERLEYTPYGEVWIYMQYGTTVFDFDTQYRFTGKEQDKETGLYYYGARYLDPKYSRWISCDPALGEYIPVAPTNDEAKKHNSNLPGNGGVFNAINLHLYHYAGNNPVKYTDPDGKSAAAVVSNPSFWSGIGTILGTIAEDIVTFGAGLADDPATLAIGASLVVGALGIAAYSNKKSDTISVSVAKVESKTKENNKGPYSVKLQFQGPSIQGASRNTGEGCVEINLRSDKPIPASAVELAVSEKYSTLSKKEQSALAGAYGKVMSTIEKTERNGGAGSFYKSYQSSTGKPGDRCDFLVTGEINLVP